MELNKETFASKTEELLKANYNLELEINKLQNEIKTSKQVCVEEVNKTKTSYEQELKTHQESNIRNKFIRETLENENKTMKTQLVSYQLKNNAMERENEELKKHFETSQSSFLVYEEKIGQLKQTVQALNEKFNERNKIEVFLSKNVSFAVESNKRLKLTVKHNECIVENYKNLHHAMEERIRELTSENQSLKAENEQKRNEYLQNIEDSNRKIEKTEEERDTLKVQLQELVEYKSKAQQSIDNSAKIINENSQVLLKNKQELKELKAKLEESTKTLSVTQANWKQFVFDVNLEINNHKQQAKLLTETAENLKKTLADFEEKNENLTEELYIKELDIHELKQFIHETESKKLNSSDNFTQTYLNNVMFDKHSQTLRTQTFDTFTQTLVKDNSKPVVSSNMAIQCNRLVFTKDISTQTEFTNPPAKAVPTPAATSVNSGRYLDNKLNDLLKQSFNNYTHRVLKNKTNVAEDTAVSLLSLPKATKPPPPSKRVTENESSSNNYNFSSTSKRVRFSEATFEIDDIEETDFRKANQDF